MLDEARGYSRFGGTNAFYDELDADWRRLVTPCMVTTRGGVGE